MALLAFAVYANALANGLVWDDPIVLDRQLLAFRSLHDIIFTPRNIPQYSPDYYRPLTTLSYLLDRAVGGGPFVFHLSVVLYHVAVTVLVFRLGLRLADPSLRVSQAAPQHSAAPPALLVAGIAAALFAVHPIHAESVAWAAGRSDVLACVFAGLAVLAYLHREWPALQRSTVAAALLFVAVLAKETAAGLFVLLPATDIVLRRPLALPDAPRRAEHRGERRRQGDRAATLPWLPRLAPFAVGLVAYVALRQAAIGTVVGGGAPIDLGALMAVVAAVGVYLGKLLLPLAQSAYISDLPTAAPAVAAIGMLLLAGAAALWFCWRRGERLVVFLGLWIVVTLAPSLTIILKIPSAPVAERYLYLPSVGFCLLAGYAAARLLSATPAGTARTFVALGAATVIAAGAIATVRRSAVWRSNLSLWSDTALKNTTDGLPLRSLGTAYLDRGERDKAAEYFTQALQRRNDVLGQIAIYNNLGSIAQVDKRLDDAERFYRTALRLEPNSPDCLFNLGLIALTRATDPDPDHDAAWKRQQAQQARELLERASQLSPLDPDIAVALGQTLNALGDRRAARAQLERALQLGLPATTETAVRRLLGDLPAS